MLSSLKRPSSSVTWTNDLIARSFLAAVEADILVAGAMAGVHGMLAYLNARTRYRFTGIYPIDRADACAYLYDREIPGPANANDPACARVALAIALQKSVAESDIEPRSRATALAGIGATLIGTDGLPWGVLCHFDQRLRAAPPTELPVLQFLGARAPVWLAVWLGAGRADQPVDP